jgi:SAM-dependent methyltransferase
MCNKACIDWGDRNLRPVEVRGRRVLEVGSYNVNGSLRPAIESLQPAEYVGIDIRSGPGVDELCPVERLAERFGRESFDLVVSTNTLEHVRRWKQAISNIKHVCRPGGIVLIAAPSDFPFHAYPNDFWRFEPTDVEDIFSDLEILVLEEDSEPPSLVYLKARRPRDFSENDLSDYQLYSVIAGRRVKEAHTLGFLTPRFGRLLLGYGYRLHVKPKLMKPYSYVTMGIASRIIEPTTRFLHGGQRG